MFKFTIALLAACSLDTSQIEQHQEGDRCGAPLYVSCDPASADHCTARCGDVLAYCPPYTWTEERNCQLFPGYTSCLIDRTQPCGLSGTPCNFHDCVYGAPALTE